MTPTLKSAEYAGEYRIRLSFSDGKVGEINLEAELWGEMFEPLKDQDLFKDFRLDARLNTVVWSNGADLAPEYLYQQAA